MFNIKLFCLILLQFSGILCINEDLKIHKNGLNKEMEQHVIAQALTITETEKDLNIAAKKISNEMNTKFGQGWNCLTGINISFTGINVESINNTFIWFSFKEDHFIVFKQITETSVHNEVFDYLKKMNAYN